jgi:hypothetical protein
MLSIYPQTPNHGFRVCSIKVLLLQFDQYFYMTNGDPVPKTYRYPLHTSKSEGPLMVVPVEAPKVLDTT